MSYSTEEVKLILASLYGLSGTIKALPGEIDLNYLVTREDDQKFTFKIANAAEKASNLEFQNKLMTHLAAKQLGLEIPKVVHSRTGKEIETSNDGEGRNRYIRLLTWVEGRPLATVSPHSAELLHKVGVLCGKLSKALEDFDHSSAHRFIKWDLAQVKWIKPHIDKVVDPRKKKLLDYFYELNEHVVVPVAGKLRKSVIYNDANDYNVLVSHEVINPSVPGVIDFGDAVYTHTVNELAIAMAYTLMHKPDPLATAFHIVKGHHEIYALQEDELKVLFSLVATRLIISVTCSQINLDEEPDNVYLQISDEAAWKLLDKLYTIPVSLAYYTFRAACGLTPCPQEEKFVTWAKTAAVKSIIDCKNLEQQYWLDLGIGSLDLGNQSEVLDTGMLNENIRTSIRQSGKAIGLGKYAEARPFYTSDAFKHEGNEGPEWRTVHLGLDVFAPDETAVYAPLDGEIVHVDDNKGDRNYGPTVIIKHQIEPGLNFYTLYGHLSKKSISLLTVGALIRAGSKIAELGGIEENGGWSPHLHFQIILDLLASRGDFYGVALPSQQAVWTSLCPDPWWLIGGHISPQTNEEHSASLVAYRQQHLGKNLSLSYHKPLHMLRGYRQFLYDEQGRKYLDTVNNVAHVGHEHARVVNVGKRQMAVLNTNTRYLHKNIIQFTEELLSTMPAELEVAYLVNSGSEANELALRIAKTYTSQKDMVVVEVGYHGNTNGCVEISSYKFDGKGGKGAPDHIQVVPMPDVFRGKYRDPKTAGKEYAKHVETAIERVKSKGRNIAGFICESVLSCGGQIVLPAGYLNEAYRIIRSSGGVCIADEVQTGCGRVGSHFWGFETQGVIPDIVTIGKPIGNGHPLGVVVTSRKMADAFANGMEYFNTFGGNPVSSAIGLEVLKVIKEEGLQQHALAIGHQLTKGLNELKSRHPIIGDIRGLGLFLGIELVNNNVRDPATAAASYLANRMRELGILMSTDGPHENVLKIKPPMVFDAIDTDFLLSSLERVLLEDFLKAGYN